MIYYSLVLIQQTGAFLQEGEWPFCVEIISIVRESESEGLRLMGSLPCKGCKGLCCGPVPLTEEEFDQIKKRLKSMPQKLKLDLKKQIRFSGTCIFYDQEKDRCSIHSARPGVCRAFGYYKNFNLLSKARSCH